MSSASLWNRCARRFQRESAARFARRSLMMRNAVPLISFTFDDFPRSALLIGGPILEDHDIAATYYASFGLMGQTAPTGEIFRPDDLDQLFAGGHELGCHTYSHCHAWDTSPADFEKSILQNRQTLRELVPSHHFESLSYPISCPRPESKRRARKYFGACRGGGQTYNAGRIDLDNLKSFFIEQALDQPEAMKSMIEATVAANGWLIFTTHDICENPTRYGCRPELFRWLVEISAKSDTRVLPVSAALREIGALSST